MKSRPRYFNFARGLNTTSGGRSGDPSNYQVFQNVEVDRGDLNARKGMVRLARITNVESILNFDATNDDVDVLLYTYSSFPPLLTTWTFEMLFQVDDISADRFIVGGTTGAAPGLTVKQTTTSTVVATITDSAAATTVLTWTGIGAGTLVGLQITRSGATLTGWLNGTTQTGTMSATLEIASGLTTFGSNNNASFLDGRIDYFRAWDIARDTKRDLYSRLLNPRNPHVIYDYVFTAGASTGLGAGITEIVDRGARGHHALSRGTATFDGAPLALNPAPIQAMGYNVRNNGTKELVVANAGRIHTLQVT